MNRILAVSVTICLSAFCSAQVKTSVSPPGFASVEAGNVAVASGGYQSGRFQFTNTYFTKKGAKLVTKVGYRREGTGWFGSNSVGRSWTNVTLDCGESKFASLSATFSLNYLRTPVRVFSGAIAWPATFGKPAKTPTPFAAVYSFSFAKPWLYTANHDAMLDYEFFGGKMAPGPAWRTGGTYNLIPYSLDAPASATAVPGVNAWYSRNAASLPCQDTGQLSIASTLPVVRVYSKTGGEPLKNNTLTLTVLSCLTAKNAQVVQALDFTGSKVGVTYGSIACNKLHVAASPLMLLMFKKADAWGIVMTSLGPIPYKPIYKGQVLWTQAIWDDSKTGQPLLTRAASITIPAQGAPPLPRVCVYSAPTTRTGIMGREAIVNPLVQWTH